MFDHVFTHVIGGLRTAFDRALLDRQALEERFQVDVFLGDLEFETSYGLPGEQRPARIRVDLSLDWPTWSQAAVRSWALGDEPDELPEVLVELAFRVQMLAEVPDVAAVVGALPETIPLIGDGALQRSAATIEHVHVEPGAGQPPEFAVEIAYDGTFQLDETALEHPEGLEGEFTETGRSVASALVRLADLPFAFRELRPGT